MRWLVVTLAAALAAFGCARPPGQPDTAATWTTYEAEITGVRPGPDERSLLIEVKLIAGHPDCARNPHITNYTEENGRIYANTVFESARSHIFGGCPQYRMETVTLTAPQPIGEREVVLNFQPYMRDGATWRKCGTLGCHPPTDPCDGGWVHSVRDGLDVPRNSAYNVEHCGDGWLVMTVNANSTVCGAEPRPGCSAPPSITRYYFRFDNGWFNFLATSAGGCDAVLKAEPKFPTKICDSLKATR